MYRSVSLSMAAVSLSRKASVRRVARPAHSPLKSATIEEGAASNDNEDEEEEVEEEEEEEEDWLTKGYPSSRTNSMIASPSSSNEGFGRAVAVLLAASTASILLLLLASVGLLLATGLVVDLLVVV